MSGTAIRQQSRWLRTAEAAGYLGVSLPTLARWRTNGTGPAYSKLRPGTGGLVVYDVEELDRFVKASTRTNTAQEVA